MRRIAWLVVLAGCGRIAFDTSGDGGAGDPMSDGAPGDDGSVALNCPATYTRSFGTSRYRVDNLNRQWLEAEQGCEADGPNSHLAVIDTLAEANGVAGFALYVNMWIGTSQRATAGLWLGVNGAAQSYLPWATNYPMSGGSQDCIEWLRFTAPGEYSNNPCSNMFPSVCECDGLPPDPTAF